MKKLLNLVAGTLVMAVVALLMYSCGDNTNNEPTPEPDMPDCGQFDRIGLNTDPEINYVSSEGGQVTVKMLWKDKNVNPSTLADEEREKYYGLDFTGCDVYGLDKEDLITTCSFLYDPDGYASLKGLGEIRATKEVGVDGYIYITIDVPQNTLSMDIQYFVGLSKVIYSSYPFYWGECTVKIIQKAK